MPGAPDAPADSQVDAPTTVRTSRRATNFMARFQCAAKYGGTSIALSYIPIWDAARGRVAGTCLLGSSGTMPMSQPQYVSLVVSSMRQAQGHRAPALILRQACAYERSDQAELATIWRKAHDQIVSSEARAAQLAKRGYISDEG